MQMLGSAKGLVLVSLLVAALGHKQASSMPTGRSGGETSEQQEWNQLMAGLQTEAAGSVHHPQNHQASPTPAARPETATSATLSSSGQFTHDYVDDDQEWNQILARLNAEAANSIRHPQNYVADDAPIEELIKLIDSEEKGSTSTDQAAGQSDETSATADSNTAQTQATESQLEECPVCQDDMLADSSRVELYCKHRFHGGCLDKWFAHQSQYNGIMSCPMCRAVVSDCSEGHVH